MRTVQITYIHVYLYLSVATPLGTAATAVYCKKKKVKITLKIKIHAAIFMNTFNKIIIQLISIVPIPNKSKHFYSNI